jgi:hypothetical protein
MNQSERGWEEGSSRTSATPGTHWCSWLGQRSLGEAGIGGFDCDGAREDGVHGDDSERLRSITSTGKQRAARQNYRAPWMQRPRFFKIKNFIMHSWHIAFQGPFQSFEPYPSKNIVFKCLLPQILETQRF